MNIDSLLNTACLDWCKYSDYEYAASKNGALYIKPTADSVLKSYAPTPLLTEMMLEALNIGHESLNLQTGETEIKTRVLHFVKKYGLLGLINTYTRPGKYTSHQSIELIDEAPFKKNKMNIKQYAQYFSVFGNFDKATDDDACTATVDATFRDYSYYFVFSKEYSERYDWILSAFQKIAKAHAHAFYYSATIRENGVPKSKEPTQIFEIKGLSYTVKMIDQRISDNALPTLFWDFTSLTSAMDTAFGFYLSDKTNPLRICKHCKKAFIAALARTEFCSPKCRNQFNVYLSRSRGRTK